MASKRYLVAVICVFALIGGFFFAASTSVQAAAESGKITLQIEGFKNKKGKALISIYNAEDNFRKVPEAYKNMTKPILYAGNLFMLYLLQKNST